MLKPYWFQRLLVPGAYMSEQSYQRAMYKYEEQLVEETMKPFVNSGHAFICFDSVGSANTILRYYKPTTARNCKIFCSGIKNTFLRLVACIGRRSESPTATRMKAQGTFMRYNEEQELINIDYDKNK